jgi:hypothetical protein
LGQVPINPLIEMWDLLDSQLPITPFYKRRCQDKCLPAAAKREVLAVQPPVMERDSASFPFPQIHFAFVTTHISSQRRQADGLCKANHSSI